MNRHDLTFMKHFAMLIAGLAVLTVVLIIFGNHLGSGLSSGQSDASIRATEARIAPVGDVHVGESGRMAILAAQEAAKAAAVVRVAFDGSLDGGMIYDQVCKACHATGAGGSPLLTRAAWEPRIAQGNETLLKHAIEGFTGAAGVMPAKGGRTDLSDEQVKATLEWMLANLQ